MGSSKKRELYKLPVERETRLRRQRAAFCDGYHLPMAHGSETVQIIADECNEPWNNPVSSKGDSENYERDANRAKKNMRDTNNKCNGCMHIYYSNRSALDDSRSTADCSH